MGIEVREPDAFYPYLAFKSEYDKKQKVLKEKRRKKRMLRKKQMGRDYDENESGSDNEIVGDEFDEQMDVDSTEEEVKQDDVALEQAETQLKKLNPDENSASTNDKQIEEEPADGDVHS